MSSQAPPANYLPAGVSLGPTPNSGGVLNLNNELQRRGKHGVIRWVDRIDGPHHNAAWTAKVYIEDIEYATGMGRTKQEARDVAAWKALRVVATWPA